MRRVIIESPYAGDVETNVAYARAAMRDALQRGEAPLASHLLYTQPGILDDGVPEERALGIRAGLEWRTAAHGAAFYIDRGWSKGMRAAAEIYEAAGIKFEERSLPAWASDAPAMKLYEAHNREFPRHGMCPWDVLTDTAKDYWRDKARRWSQSDAA